MSGESFNLTWEDRDARRSLARLTERGDRLRSLMVEIGQELVRSTLQRFEAEADPDGCPWVELKDSTKVRKRGGKKLEELGYLKGGIAVLKATENFVEIGAGREYACTSIRPGPWGRHCWNSDKTVSWVERRRRRRDQRNCL